jgi:hypothetical protein
MLALCTGKRTWRSPDIRRQHEGRPVSAVQNIALPSEPGDVHDVPAAARSCAHRAAELVPVDAVDRAVKVRSR